jgi:hypothetical protein
MRIWHRAALALGAVLARAAAPALAGPSDGCTLEQALAMTSAGLSQPRRAGNTTESRSCASDRAAVRPATAAALGHAPRPGRAHRRCPSPSRVAAFAVRSRDRCGIGNLSCLPNCQRARVPVAGARQRGSSRSCVHAPAPCRCLSRSWMGPIGVAHPKRRPEGYPISGLRSGFVEASVLDARRLEGAVDVDK